MRSTIARWPYLSALVVASSPYASRRSTSAPSSTRAIAMSTSPCHAQLMSAVLPYASAASSRARRDERLHHLQPVGRRGVRAAGRARRRGVARAPRARDGLGVAQVDLEQHVPALAPKRAASSFFESRRGSFSSPAAPARPRRRRRPASPGLVEHLLAARMRSARLSPSLLGLLAVRAGEAVAAAREQLLLGAVGAARRLGRGDATSSTNRRTRRTSSRPRPPGS